MIVDKRGTPIGEFVTPDTPESERSEARDLELLRAGIEGTVALDDLPAHIRERVLLRQHGISISPFAAGSDD